MAGQAGLIVLVFSFWFEFAESQRVCRDAACLLSINTYDNFCTASGDDWDEVCVCEAMGDPNCDCTACELEYRENYFAEDTHCACASIIAQGVDADEVSIVYPFNAGYCSDELTNACTGVLSDDIDCARSGQIGCKCNDAEEPRLTCTACAGAAGSASCNANPVCGGVTCDDDESSTFDDGCVASSTTCGGTPCGANCDACSDVDSCTTCTTPSDGPQATNDGDGSCTVICNDGFYTDDGTADGATCIAIGPGSPGGKSGNQPKSENGHGAKRVAKAKGKRVAKAIGFVGAGVILGGAALFMYKRQAASPVAEEPNTEELEHVVGTDLEEAKELTMPTL